MVPVSRIAPPAPIRIPNMGISRVFSAAIWQSSCTTAAITAESTQFTGSKRVRTARKIQEDPSIRILSGIFYSIIHDTSAKCGYRFRKRGSVSQRICKSFQRISAIRPGSPAADSHQDLCALRPITFNPRKQNDRKNGSKNQRSDKIRAFLVVRAICILIHYPISHVHHL